MTKHKRGVGKKPGVLNLIVPQQKVIVIGMNYTGDKQLFHIRLESGQHVQVPAAWLGGAELAIKAMEAQRDARYAQLEKQRQDEARSAGALEELRRQAKEEIA